MGWYAAIVGYLRNALLELRQVRWPTRNQAVRLSTIVILFTFATALAYGIVDFLFGRGLALLLFFA
jgi:preprotein translocase SecE subunit